MRHPPLFVRLQGRLGAGGLTGRGYLQGIQLQLDFLSEQHTDIAFAILGEEWGFTGALPLLAVYATLPLVAWPAITKFCDALITIAMVTGLVPAVGVPLPLVSYGVTAMATVLCGLRLAHSAHLHTSHPLPLLRYGGLFSALSRPFDALDRAGRG